MVHITDRPEHDPVADMKLIDAYMRWAMEAARQVIGDQALNSVLREAGLEHFIDNPPPGELTISGDVTYGDYARFNTGLLNFFQRSGRGMMLRIGRESAKMAIAHQSGVFNLATVFAARLLPASTQAKMGLSAMMSGFKVLNDKARQEWKGHVEDAGDSYHFIIETCPLCAGKQADTKIGWLMEATIEESSRQVFGKFFDVVEIACKAQGAPAGVWEVPKQPGEEGANRSAI